MYAQTAVKKATKRQPAVRFARKTDIQTRSIFAKDALLRDTAAVIVLLLPVNSAANTSINQNSTSAQNARRRDMKAFAVLYAVLPSILFIPRTSLSQTSSKSLLKSVHFAARNIKQRNIFAVIAVKAVMKKQLAVQSVRKTVMLIHSIPAVPAVPRSMSRITVVQFAAKQDTRQKTMCVKNARRRDMAAVTAIPRRVSCA